MAKYLVIVESPAKVKTIKKFLGKNYEVSASNGHVRDLPKSQLGFDKEGGFEPKYITIRGKGDILSALRRKVKKADKIYLATDPDREGEAISWHLAQALKLPPGKTWRITFNEITKNAVKESLKSPRDINMDLVNAQQARRMLDRMVGYSISPLLWAKVKRGLSAGRVQSVALKMICDREDEINAFIPKEYWTIEAVLSHERECGSGDITLGAGGGRASANASPEAGRADADVPRGAGGDGGCIKAALIGDKGGKISIESGEQAARILRGLEEEVFEITELKKGERIRKAPLPFNTSTMQQEAGRRLGFSAQKTMRIAQQLYEGISLKGDGTVGLISYLRTDSVRVSEEARAQAADFIEEKYGEKYLSAGENEQSAKGKIQDAHEAIRPTDLRRTPGSLKDSLGRDQYRLYQLIYLRFLASRMSAAVYENVTLKIGAGEYIFSLSDSRVVFDGFLSVCSDDEKKETEEKIPAFLKKGDKLLKREIIPEQHFTQPPAHFTESTLIKALEEQGIGRPSTYAPIISTLINRRYVIKEKKNLHVSEIGEVVNRIMKETFPQIVEKRFTANMESLLDKVEEGKIEWKSVVENFYPDLEEAVEAAQRDLEKVKIKDEVSEEICKHCGRNMVIKYGPHGRFLACPGFPECKNTKPYLEKTGVACPRCGGEVVRRNTKKGRVFYGCEKSPDCDFMSWQKPAGKPCPICGGYMVEKGKRIACADKNCGYTKERRLNDD